MTVEIILLSHDELLRRREELVSVYAAAFSPPPYRIRPGQLENFAYALAGHGQRQGFRCLAALDPEGGRVIGFTYGYHGSPGQWWRDAVYSALPEREWWWLEDYFELAELAVVPWRQGQGIGSRLHDGLLDGGPERTAALSTLQVETAALRLYRRRGWQVLLQGMVFPGGIDRYQIMGLRLRPNAEDRSA